MSRPQTSPGQLLLLLFAISASIIASAYSAYATEILIAYENKAQPPYYLGNSNIPLPSNPGVTVEMIQMLEHRIPNLKIRLTRLPWKRCLEDLQLGEVDGIFKSSFSKARMALGRYPMKNGQIDQDRRVAILSYNFYRMPGSSFRWDGHTISGLKGVVGAPLGYAIIQDLERMGVQVETAPSTKLVMTKLIEKRNSAAALQAVSADALRDCTPAFRRIIKIEPPLKVKEYYLMLSHQFVERNPQLAEKIWDELATIRNEESSRLLRKYQKDTP